MINKTKFEQIMLGLQKDMVQLSDHCKNQLSSGMNQPFVAQYQFIVVEAENIRKWAALSKRESSAITRSPQNFLQFYGEVAVMHHNYNKGVDEPIKGRGNYDFTVNMEQLLRNLSSCVS